MANYAYLSGSDGLSVVDVNALTTVGSVVSIPDGAGGGIKINPAKTTAYVTSDTASGVVSVVDLASLTVTTTVSVGDTPRAITIDPTGAYAYVVNTISKTVSVIDLSSNTVVATATLLFPPGGIAIRPQNDYYYVVNSNTLSVISTTTNTIVTTVPALGTNPAGGVAINPAGTVAVVPSTSPSTGNAEVFFIDLSTNTVLHTVSFTGTGRFFDAVAVDNAGDFCYLADVDTDEIVSINMTTYATASLTSAIGATPNALIVTPDDAYLAMSTNSFGFAGVLTISSNSFGGITGTDNVATGIDLGPYTAPSGTQIVMMV